MAGLSNKDFAQVALIQLPRERARGIGCRRVPVMLP